MKDIYNENGQDDVRLYVDDRAIFMHHPDLNAALTFDILNIQRVEKMVYKQ